jgi:hypothetical protein
MSPDMFVLTARTASRAFSSVANAWSGAVPDAASLPAGETKNWFVTAALTGITLSKKAQIAGSADRRHPVLFFRENLLTIP